MKLIDGKKISLEIRENLKKEIEKYNIKPSLAIILVGEDEASKIYVRNKLKACSEIGIEAKVFNFNADVAEEELILLIKKLNADNNIDGIIVQSPLPKNLNEYLISNTIDPSKDVDGFGSYNLGLLAANKPNFIAATPLGILKLLEYENIELEGKNVVIIGRSIIVGRPLLLALLNKDATVTITHSKTKNLKEITKKADILIVAIGKANYITEEYIKENAVIIDVGINRVEGKLYGDVDFNRIKDKVSYITPVPGGVGPLTVAMLLSNVVEARKKKEGI